MGFWEDSPNATSPISAANLSRLEKYTQALAGSNGDFYLSITNAANLAAGDVVRVSFPSATDNTETARLSIDGGSTYITIQNSLGNIITAEYIEGHYKELIYDGTYFVVFGTDEKNIITAGIASNATLSGTSETALTLSTEIEKRGQNLSISAGRVYTSGIKSVKVSASVLFSATVSANDLIIIYIRKNGGTPYGLR